MCLRRALLPNKVLSLLGLLLVDTFCDASVCRVGVLRHKSFNKRTTPIWTLVSVFFADLIKVATQNKCPSLKPPFDVRSAAFLFSPFRMGLDVEIDVAASAAASRRNVSVVNP